MGPESLVGFMTILTYWRAPPDRGPIRRRPLAARGAVVRVGLFLQLFIIDHTVPGRLIRTRENLPGEF